MKNILVPCDFSAPAQEAFKFAVSLARQSNGAVDVLHVIDMTFLKGHPTLAYSYAFTAAFLKELEADSNEKFQTMRQKFSPRTLPVTYHYRMGSLLVDIEQYIRERSIDLVVMGTHGVGGAALGSNAEKVVRNASVPVLVLRACPEKPVTNIVFPVLVDLRNRQLADEVKELREFFGAMLQLLWINTPFAFRSDTESHAELSRYAQEHTFSNYVLNVRADYTVEEGVLRFAKESRADLIAMGTHARKGLSHWLTGSITEAIVSHAGVPVWTRALRSSPENEETGPFSRPFTAAHKGEHVPEW